MGLNLFAAWYQIARYQIVMAGLDPAIRSGTSPRQIADGLLAVTHGSQSFRRQVSDQPTQ
jgi:hypothetical protein